MLPAGEPSERPSTEPDERDSYLFQLFRGNLPDRGPLADYGRWVIPRLFAELSDRPAKGGSGSDRFETFVDQSYVAHILNGLFPTWRLMELVDDRRRNPFTDAERRVFLVAWTLHDLNKLIGSRELPADRGEFWRVAGDWLTRLHLDRVLPDWGGYRDDLLFLIQNTQRARDTNQNLAMMAAPVLTGRKREAIANLCGAADALASGIAQPRDIDRAQQVRYRLGLIGDGLLRFAYHQVADVRGILTNFIHNAAMDLFRNRGWQPFLFFPQGVAYVALASRDDDPGPERPTLNGDALYAPVVEALRRVAGNEVRYDLKGFTRKSTEVQFPDYYRLLLTTPELVRVCLDGVFARVNSNKAPARFQAIVQGLGASAPPLEELPADLRVDRAAEFLTLLERELVEAGINREAVYREIVSALGLSGSLSAALAVQSLRASGGLKLDWFYLAAAWLQRTKHGDGELHSALSDVSGLVLAKFEGNLARERPDPFEFLRSYLARIFGGSAPDFAAELDRYERSGAGGRGSGLVCSMCSSPEAAEEQMEAGVLFAPQVFSNRNPLGGSRLKRGICRVCSLEMMLRQLLWRGTSFVPGGGFESQRIKFLYVYPSYYFSAETAAIVGRALSNLRHVNLYELLATGKDGRGLGFARTPAAEDYIRASEAFIKDVQEDELRCLAPEYPEGYIAGFQFAAVPPGSRDPSATESWIRPGLLALALPLLLGVRVVATESAYPIFGDGRQFRATVVLDGPHRFLTHLLGIGAGRSSGELQSFRINEVLPALNKIAGAYRAHLDVNAQGPKPNWERINALARDAETDPLALFQHLLKLRRRERRGASFDAIPEWYATRFLLIYRMLNGGDPVLIRELVDRYAKFYRHAKWSSYSMLRPLALAARVILAAEPEIEKDDLLLVVQGEIERLMQRVHQDKAEGRWVYKFHDRFEEQAAIAEFARYMVEEVFERYCRGDRALLRERLNRLKAAAECDYRTRYARGGTDAADEETPPEEEEEAVHV